MTSKEDGLLYSFVQQFADSLAVEYRFVEDVAHGITGTRPDYTQRHMSLLFDVVNFAANPASMGSDLVALITEETAKRLENGRSTNSENCHLALAQHSPDKRTFLFKQIATEVMYRYGSAIYHFVELVGPGNANLALARLARTGAIRIIYYALKRNVGFKYYEKLVRGDLLLLLIIQRVIWIISNVSLLCFQGWWRALTGSPSATCCRN
jgi:hypothetical protein